MSESEINSVLQLKKGDILNSIGDDVNYLYLIIKGSVTAYAAYGRFKFGPGTIAGITGSYYGIYTYTYVADSDTIVRKFKYSNASDISVLCNICKNDAAKLAAIHNRFSFELIKTYLTLFMKCKKKDSNFKTDIKIEKWELDKYNALAAISSDILDEYLGSNPAIAAASLIEVSKFTSTLNDVCLQMADFLEINYEYKAPVLNTPSVKEISYMEPDSDYSDEEIASTLKDSLIKILKYGDIYIEDADLFVDLINRFKNIPDKLSSDDEARHLRKSISDMFYDIYYDVFMKSINDDNIPPYVFMFLNFGYVDEELLGMDNSVSLFKISQNIDDICNNSHVHTIYRWLMTILWGEKEPSKNQLDQNYDEYIKEESRNGRLSCNLEDALDDNEMKLKYEIKNMFTHTHRMTCGKITSFVAVLISDNIYKPFFQMLSSADNIMNAVNSVRTLDYSVFYRSTVYNLESLGVSKEYVYTEVLPDIILMPCVGSMGIMWQEIEGRKRLSSARFMLPIFCYAKLNSIVINIIGKYRWEICKRIQGIYWNNISEKSLTSEYCDYLQFYKKNRDIPDSAKEKIHTSIQNYRNNFSEIFAKDYEMWIIYESTGVGKLNKISRNILSKYCPFNNSVRAQLKINPLFTEAIETYERSCMAPKRRIDNICKTLTSKNISIPREIRETKAFYNK